MDLIFKIENESEFKRAVEDIIINCYNINTNNSNDPAKEEFRTLILQTNCELPKLEKILSQKGFEKQRVLYLLDFIESKKNELIYLSLINYNSKYGEAVSDFDWNLKLVNGTSELKNLKYPLLQLSLSTYKNGVQSHRTVDINKDALAMLINILEVTEL